VIGEELTDRPVYFAPGVKYVCYSLNIHFHARREEGRIRLGGRKAEVRMLLDHREVGSREASPQQMAHSFLRIGDLRPPGWRQRPEGITDQIWELITQAGEALGRLEQIDTECRRERNKFRQGVTRHLTVRQIRMRLAPNIRTVGGQS
jgi:hypothetical protein